MQVEFSQKFKTQLKNFPKADQLKIYAFYEHVKSKGFEGLLGKNVVSDNVPTDDPSWHEKVTYAQRHNLWHYHIGIPEYQPSEVGDYLTSEYVLHYIKSTKQGEDCITIVDMSSHPPFELPKEEYLTV